MSTVTSKARSPGGDLAFSTNGSNTLGLVVKYLGLMILDAMTLIFVYSFFYDGNYTLGIVFALVALIANVIILVPGLWPLRWMTPGLMLITLLVIYPVFYTVLTAFTNYGDGHLLTKDQTIRLIEQRTYVPEDAPLYSWEVYQAEDGTYALWLTRELEDGTLEVVFAPQNASIEAVENPPAEPPPAYEDFTLLDAGARTRALSTLQTATFGDGEDTAAIANRRQVARPLGQRYVYDEETDTMTDQQSGTVYVADNETGIFAPPRGTGDPLAPGYRVNVGLDNFRRLYEDRTRLEPLIQVFIWTVAFSALSVLTTFAMGLAIALIFDTPDIPVKKLWRSLIFIPYAIPGVISIVVWNGMLNQNLGILTNTIVDVFGYRVPWETNASWARFSIILVNLWLGYPYMMLICSGALQSIPSEVYEAAAVDGARGWTVFWRITLPLLLVSVGPLLIASFTYNFNNFLLIEALTQGNPPIPNTSTRVGKTDILITYTYRLAFGSDRGADYGYASAITLVIFAIVGLITLFNYRFTRTWEAVGENV